MREKNKALIYLLPALLLIFTFKVLPLALAVVDSFFKEGNLTLDNYLNLFNDQNFINSLFVTFKFNIIVTPVQIVLAIGLALLVNQKLKGINVIRSVLYVPITVSMVVATIVFSLIFNYNTGIVNLLLESFGLERQLFLNSADQALYIIIVIATWKGVAYWMLFLFAGLKNIPMEYYEAAKVDGSNPITTFYKITVPSLKNILTFVVISDTIANLLLFAPVDILTSGGPEGSTNLLMYEGYVSYFKYFDSGRGGAIITILLLIITIVISIQFLILREKKNG